MKEESSIDSNFPFKRILLKVSGEALAGDKGQGISIGVLQELTEDILSLHNKGIDICVVIGGGNIIRGAAFESSHGIDRVTADYMGMLATVMNALAFKDVLETAGLSAQVVSAIRMPTICQPFYREKCLNHLRKRRVIIFAGGSGNPYFTTDTAAVLRASEMKCDVLLKATKVDGIYSSDPIKDSRAIHYPHLTYMDVLSKDLRVMDSAAISLAKENNIPILIFSMKQKNALASLLSGHQKYSLLDNNEEPNA